ncbi:MAG: hypothetical protein IPG64_11325 [Haliea sp.]|nr:hypothetical protein [Haliea sp.]
MAFQNVEISVSSAAIINLLVANFPQDISGIGTGLWSLPADSGGVFENL